MKLSTALVVALAGSALAFGAVYRWAYVPLLVFCVSVGVWGLWRGHLPLGRSGPILRWSALTAMAILLTLLPIPPQWLGKLSPGVSAFLKQYEFAYALVAPALSPPWHALSINPYKTSVALCFVVAFGVYALGLARLINETMVRKIARGTVAVGALLAFVGIIQHAGFNGKLYGFFEPSVGIVPFTPDGGAFGPFVNRNHFAGWMIMAIPLAMGYLSGILHVSMRNVRPDWRSRLIWFSQPSASEAFLVSAAIIVMSIALLMTLSRSGAVCLAVTLMAMSVTMIKGHHSWRRLAVAAFLLALIVIGPQSIDLDSISARFNRLEHDAAGRIRPWQDAISVIRDYPLTGTGLNTYGTAMLSYQTYRLGEAHYGEAHNDYLQLAAEGGTLLLVPVGVLAYQIARRMHRQLQHERLNAADHWIRTGAVAGVAAMLLQEVVEFSLQIPANAFFFVTLIVIATYEAAETRKPADMVGRTAHA